MSNIKIFETSLILSEAFAKDFIEKCNSLISEKGNANIALSGGNTPKLLFTILADEYLNEIDWQKLNFYWVDERCVPADSIESNFGEAERILFSKTNSDKNIHRIIGEEDPVKEAERYSEVLKNNLPVKNNFPEFDLILLGMGDDGHTASIFPERMDLLNSEKYAEVAVHPDTKQNRITLTGKVINNSSKIVFLVTGKNKSGIVKDILEKKNGSENYPAAHIKGDGGNVVWYFDSDAASLLEK